MKSLSQLRMRSNGKNLLRSLVGFFALNVIAAAGFLLVFNRSLYGADLSSQFLTNRTVEIEWDEVPGATQYDLEIYDGKQKRFIKTFTSKSNIFKLNVKMGKYHFRSRILDKFGRSSEWTDMSELLIAPPPTQIQNKITEEVQLFADKKSGFYDFVLNWKSLPGVEEYKVILEAPDGKMELEKNVKGTETTIKLPAGQHRLRVRAVLSDGTLGELSDPTSVISVLGAKIQKPSVVFQRDPQSGPQVYFRSELSVAQFDGELYYKPHEGLEWKKVKDFRDLKVHQISFVEGYTPGRYQIKLQARSNGFTPSEYGSTEFVIKPTENIINAIPLEITPN